jgi:hypothetical protein
VTLGQGADPIGVLWEKRRDFRYFSRVKILLAAKLIAAQKAQSDEQHEGLSTCSIRLKQCLTFPKIKTLGRVAGLEPVNAAKRNSLMVDRVCKPQLFYCKVYLQAT